jgi:hypothetical protein
MELTSKQHPCWELRQVSKSKNQHKDLENNDAVGYEPEMFRHKD